MAKVEGFKRRDEVALTIKRIDAGEPICESWLKGNKLTELHRAGVTAEQIKPYRQALERMEAQIVINHRGGR